MRRQGWGKVVNVSSMGGEFVFPGGGLRRATEYALEALSDALRFEVKGFGIDVIVIQPGLIRTGASHATVRELDAATPSDGPYAEFNNAVGEASVGACETGLPARLAGPPEAVAESIETALGAKRAETRYEVTASARVLMGLNAVLPDRGWVMVLRSSFPGPG